MSHRHPLLVLAALPLVLGGCYAAATEAGRMDLVRKQAARDLKCPTDQLSIERETGFTYRVEGCDKRSFQEVVCIEGDCQSESKLTETLVKDDQVFGKITVPRRLVSPGAHEEDMPMPDPLAVLERPYAGTFRVCVTPSGSVGEVEVVKSTGNTEVDTLWRDKLLTWRFEPPATDAPPSSLCNDHTIRYARSERRPPDRLTPARFFPR
jgi:hypothetical protein